MQVKNGQANIYNGLNVSGSTSLKSSGSTVLSIDGTSGRLFSVDDSLSGSLFSVNTAAGLPVMEAFSDNTVRVGQYGTLALFVSKSRVGIGKESGLNANLDVLGTAIVSGSAVGSPAFYVTNGGVQFGSTTGFVWDASNSRLGIGTNSPGAPLQVNGIILANNGSVRVYAAGPSSFSFFVAYPDESNTDNYKIITRGNGLFASRNFMKLGATSYAELTTNPTAVLELCGSTTSNASLRIRSGSAPTSPNDGDIWYSGSQIVFRAGLNASGSTSIIGSGSSLLTIDGVSGRLFQVDDSLSGSLFSVNNSTGLPLIEAFSDDTIRMGQFGTRTLFVSQSRVGIGIETPTTKLDISGSVRMSFVGTGTDQALTLSGSFTQGGTSYFDFIRAFNSSASAANPRKSFRINGSNGDLEIINSAYSTNIFTLTDAGVLSTPGGGTSDARVKDNIQYINTSTTNIIKQLKPVEFEFKNNLGVKRHGFIAQDVLEVKPDLVLGDGDQTNGTYGLDYDGILALTVKSLQEALARIEVLENEIKTLKG